MNGYSYKLYTDKNNNPPINKGIKYTRNELIEMTTFQLRNICYRERLSEGIANTLDRERLIQIILKYRSAEDCLLIKTYQQEGFTRVQTALNHYLKRYKDDRGKIKIPAKMILYSGLKVDKEDQYYVEVPDNICESNVLLVNEHNELCAIFNLVKDEHESDYYLALEEGIEVKETRNKNYSFLFFRKQDSEFLYHTYYAERKLPPTNLYYYKVPIIDLEIRAVEETEAILAIDFGTSNTTAGVFLDSQYISAPNEHDLINNRIQLNSINFVSFPNATNSQVDWIEVLPTVVAIVDCSNPKKIRYSFGYEALKSMKKAGHNSHATVFHGIKRWVNDYDRIVEVRDHDGNTAQVNRKDILTAYLTYVIKLAEHQFKCHFKKLHISSPVKLKTQFLEMFQDILPDYKVEYKHALDEGMAVLFNTIANQIEKNNFINGEEYKALVIDCGGGTTDLSSCTFRIKDGHISYQVEIQTTYENGDTNFGGNNLTYRIMQYMKVVFAAYYNHKTRIEIDELIDIPGTDIFRQVDDLGLNGVYEKLEESYRAAEELLPTQFKVYESKNQDEYQKVQSNFYFLWELAEEMKQEFFRKTGILRNRFHTESGSVQENDLKVTYVDRWSLFVREKGKLKNVSNFPDVIFNIREINQLIKGDIYEILRKFLEDFYWNGKLSEYAIIKLTGQSCRIDVFREALKEFVPGKSIEFRQKAEESGKVPDLKLACLRGALRYLSAQKLGMIEATIMNNAPMVPYSVTAFTHNQLERVLIQSHNRLNQVQGFISRPIEVTEVEFYLKGSNGNVSHQYIYMNYPERYRRVLYEDIYEMYGEKIPQDDTDSIVNGEVKFFVFTMNDHWGFHIVPVARKDEQLYLGKKDFFPFETDLSELDFFDGMK